MKKRFMMIMIIMLLLPAAVFSRPVFDFAMGSVIDTKVEDGKIPDIVSEFSRYNAGLAAEFRIGPVFIGSDLYFQDRDYYELNIRPKMGFSFQGIKNFLYFDAYASSGARMYFDDAAACFIDENGSKVPIEAKSYFLQMAESPIAYSLFATMDIWQFNLSLGCIFDTDASIMSVFTEGKFLDLFSINDCRMCAKVTLSLF